MTILITLFTVMILVSFRTVGQTVQTRVWSGYTLPAIPSASFTYHYSMENSYLSNFTVITAYFSVIQIFRNFTVGFTAWFLSSQVKKKVKNSQYETMYMYLWAELGHTCQVLKNSKGQTARKQPFWGNFSLAFSMCWKAKKISMGFIWLKPTAIRVNSLVASVSHSQHTATNSTVNLGVNSLQNCPLGFATIK